MAPDREASRRALHARLQAVCPLTVRLEEVSLPGGLLLRDDEFVVRMAKDWGLSGQKLTLTTQRLICPIDPSSTTMESVPLVDVRDVTLRKHFVAFATVAVHTTAGGKFLFPAHINGQRIRDDILAMVEFLQRPARPTLSVVTEDPGPADRYDQLRKIAELKVSGVLSDAEYEQEKARILRGP